MKYKLTNPMTCPSGYSMDLYCDHANDNHVWNEFPHSFLGETYSECATQAVKLGWIIHRKTATATCPKCNRKYTNDNPKS